MLFFIAMMGAATLYAGFMTFATAFWQSCGMSATQSATNISFLSFFGALISMVGDLAASAIKRNQGIKDYGKLIPGHGGILDRFDSVIFTAPIIYFLSVLLIH